MENRAAVVVGVWLAVAIIASAYMLAFADTIGDLLFGVFLPVGLLVLVAVAVTFGLAARPEHEKARAKS